MAAIDLHFDLKMDDGRDISAMRNIIDARVADLGETTKQSTIAIAINILRSLRNDTLVAKVKGKYQIKNVTSSFYPSFSRTGGRYHRVLRAGKNGGEVQPSIGVIWASKVGQKEHTYHVKDLVAPNKVIEYMLVIDSMESAKNYVTNQHETRVKAHRGLAKTALGVAMHEVSKSENVNGPISYDIVDIADKNTEVKVQDTGFNNGNVTVEVHDKLDYSAVALRHGANYVQTAIQKTLNKMTAFLIHKLHNRGIQSNLNIPYPEIKRGTQE